MGNINSCCVHASSSGLKIEPVIPSKGATKSLHKNSHYKHDSFNTQIQYSNTFGDSKCMEAGSRRGMSDDEFETPVWKHMDGSHAQPATYGATNRELMNVPEENVEEISQKNRVVSDDLLDDKSKLSFVSSHYGDDLEISEVKSNQNLKGNKRKSSADQINYSTVNMKHEANGKQDVVSITNSSPSENQFLLKAQNSEFNARQNAVNGDIQKSASEHESNTENASSESTNLSLSSANLNTGVTNSTERNTNSAIKPDLIEQSEKVFQKTIEKNNEDYIGFDKIYEESKDIHKLKIYFSSYITPEKNRANKVRCEWYVPVTPEQFIKFMSNTAEQWKVDDGSMEQFMSLATDEKDDQSFMLYYLSYKKRLMVSARDLVYIKQFKKIDNETWADASISMQDSQFPANKGFVRCENLGGGHYVKLISGTEENNPISLVKMYSETDFKANVPAFMAKSLTQESMKGFIERSIKRLKVLYPA